jgi:class 3 adenylate cyclase
VVSVLFSDMAGFTALTETSDPEDVRQIMGDVYRCASEIVTRYGGRVEKFIGDAVMAIFGVPTSHEDDQIRAVRAAVELHEAVANLKHPVTVQAGLHLAMHSGVNTGVVVTGELHFGHGVAGPLGDTINTAARLMGAALTGEIWIGAETRRVVAPVFEVEDLGLQSFKGKANAVHASRVLRLRARSTAPSHQRGAFVGRQAQLAMLLSAAEGVRDGRTAKFGVRGDAGSDKTRLLNEFRSRLGHDVQWLEGRAYPFAQQIACSPVTDLLSRLWRLDEAKGPTELRAAIQSAVSSLLGDAPGVVPLLYHLFNLPQDAGTVVEREVFQERLLAAFRQMLAALRLRGLTVVCLQDLHWADASTLILWNGLCADPGVPVAESNVGLMAHTVSTPAGGDRLLTLHCCPSIPRIG